MERKRESENVESGTNISGRGWDSNYPLRERVRGRCADVKRVRTFLSRAGAGIEGVMSSQKTSNDCRMCEVISIVLLHVPRTV